MTILKSKLVFAFKDANTPAENKKPRLVARAVGKMDKDNKLLFTYSPTVTIASILIMLWMPTTLNLRVYLCYVSLDHVTSEAKTLDRNLYNSSKRAETRL